MINGTATTLHLELGLFEEEDLSSKKQVIQIYPSFDVSGNLNRICVTCKDEFIEVIPPTSTTLDKSKMDEGWVDFGEIISFSEALKILK